ALKKALSKSEPAPQTKRLSLPDTAMVTSMKRSALISELKEKGIRFHKRGDTGLDVSTAALGRIRCYDEALFFVGTLDNFKLAAENLNSFGCTGLPYRIEAGDFRPEERRAIIQKISLGMSKFGYTDNPSSYAFELRPLFGGNIYAIFKQKQRFDYRVQSISASINPVTAACVMQICKPYMKENADVLDPFCGSATMLIERGLIKTPNSLVGVDISAVAIKAAVANRKASKQNISLIKSDVLFYSASKFDEIISNMPFGNRVSGHESNIRLYNLFVERLDTLLKPDGIAFLYTQEKKLLRSEINQNDIFTIVKEEVFESGGLFPTLFIIKRK
ncbi:MAG: methyltransferase, partial [Clostridia bacterium]|nr:methyltransferase [Clostridia bacterium]